MGKENLRERMKGKGKGVDKYVFLHFGSFTRFPAGTPYRHPVAAGFGGCPEISSG